MICPRCKGSGKEGWMEQGAIGFCFKFVFGRDECPRCNGKGEI